MMKSFYADLLLKKNNNKKTFLINVLLHIFVESKKSSKEQHLFKIDNLNDLTATFNQFSESFLNKSIYF